MERAIPHAQLPLLANKLAGAINGVELHDYGCTRPPTAVK